MPRPRRYKGYRITSFYIPVEFEDLSKKAEELMKIEGLSFSELLLEALKEYVEVHYPGNPQLTLPSICDQDSEKPLRLVAKFDCEELETILKELKDSRGSLEYKRDLRERCKKLLIKLCRANIRLKDEKINELIDHALKKLENNDSSTEKRKLKL